MSLGKIIFYGIVIVGLSIVLVFLLLRPPSATDITREIKNANFCGSEEDCVVIAPKCPLDCHILINKGSQDQIQELIGNFKSDCEQECTEIIEFRCIQNKCQPTKTE